MIETVFLFCFLFGLIFSGASFLLGLTGSVLPHLHLGGPQHANHPGNVVHAPIASDHATASHAFHPGSQGTGHGPGGQPLEGLPLLSLSALLAFLTAFGGVGYILTHYTGFPVALAVFIAFAAGCGGDILIAAFLSTLLRSEHVLDPSEFRLEGVTARVSVGIGENRVGEVIYSLNGRRWSEAARSLDGKPVAKGSKVVIVRFEKGVAYVQPWNDFVAGSAPELIEDADDD
jgi:membrane protein implicated in regulation of membrane protease activity